MKKNIIIEETEQGQRMVHEGFTPFEMLGLLRFYEKFVWLQIERDIEKQLKDSKQKAISEALVKELNEQKITKP